MVPQSLTRTGALRGVGNSACCHLTALRISCGVLPPQLLDADRLTNDASFMTAMAFLVNTSRAVCFMRLLGGAAEGTAGTLLLSCYVACYIDFALRWVNCSGRPDRQSIDPGVLSTRRG
jgi:hypothetical protein